MAPSSETGQPGPNDKVLHVWSKPIEKGDHVPGQSADVGGAAGGEAGGSKHQQQQQQQSASSFSEAVGQIKKEDFLNVANTPCARQGLLTGIASGAGLGGLKFVVNGNATRAANWAVGFFVLGSIASYEYCQYQRRAERIQMKRNIEIVTENRREQARKLAEDQRLQVKLQEEQQQQQQQQRAKGKSWFKFW